MFSKRNYLSARFLLGVLLLVCVPLVLAGCNGSDDSGQSTPKVSPFAGSYTGTFVFKSTTNTDTGNVMVTISDDGTVNGNVTNTTSGQTGPVSGMVSNNGSTSGSASFTVGSGTGSTTSTGTIGFASNGHLTGTLKQFSSGKQIGTTTIDLVKNPVV